MAPSDRMRREIMGFATDWVATEGLAHLDRAKEIDLLASEITRLVDEAVREAVLITAEVVG